MRGRQLLKIFAVVGGLLVAFLITVIGVEKWRGRSRLNKVIQHVKAAGVSLDWRTAFAHNIPKEENAATGLTDLADDIRSHKLPVEFPPRGMVIESPGLARSSVFEEFWSDAAGNTYAWSELAGAGEDIQSLMTRISEAAAKPRFASPFDPGNGFADMKLESLPMMPGVMRVCNVAAMLALREGDGPKAIRIVDTLLSFYCNKAEDPILIAQMIRWSQCRVAYGLTWELVQHARADDSTWARLQESWSRCKFLDDSVAAWEVELAGIHQTYHQLKDSPSYRKRLLGNFESFENDYGLVWNPPARGLVLRSLILPAWSLLWADQNHAHSLEDACLDRNLTRMAQTNTWVTTKAAAERAGRHTEAMATASLAFSVPELSYYDRCRYLFDNGPTLILGSHLHRVLRAQTEANMAVAVIALKRHQIMYGEYPKTLAQLIPNFISEIPSDPFDQEPLRYRLTDNGGFVLYSVGSNGVDDGGSSEPTIGETKAFDGGWSAQDFVWMKRTDAR